VELKALLDHQVLQERQEVLEILDQLDLLENRAPLV